MLDLNANVYMYIIFKAATHSPSFYLNTEALPIDIFMFYILYDFYIEAV